MLRASALPVPPTRLIGRDADVAACCARLRSNDHRLLTLIGPAGVGKTRLALAVADALSGDFSAGVVFIPLAPLTDPALVLSEIARALGVRETRSRPLVDGVIDRLRNGKRLLVLDNFEQLLGAATLVAELLAACPDLTMLTTSRSPLHIRGERVFPVAPLVLPPDSDGPVGTNGVRLEPALAYPAVALFVERATDQRPQFAVAEADAPVLVEICRRLDGLPLAIELAAARVKALSIDALRKRLERPLGVLTDGARDLPERQQTLENAIAWSYDLLAPREQRLFRRLGVFAGGCSMAAIEAVCAADDPEIDVLGGVTALLDASLLNTVDTPDTESRISMLETIRAFAWRRLEESGESAAMQQRHAEYFTALAEDAELFLFGFHRAVRVIAPAGGGTSSNADADWASGLDALLRRLARDLANFRAALDWARASKNRPFEIRLIGSLWNFWVLQGLLSESQGWLEQVLDDGTDAYEPSMLLLLMISSQTQSMVGDYDRSAEYSARAHALAVRTGDGDRARVTMGLLAYTEWCRGNGPRAMELVEKCLGQAREAGDIWSNTSCLTIKGMIQAEQGDLDSGLTLLDEVLTIARSLHQPQVESFALAVHAKFVLDAGHLDRAAQFCRESLSVIDQFPDPWTPLMLLATTAGIALKHGAPERAAQLLSASDAFSDAMGMVLFPAWRADQQCFAEAAHIALGESRCRIVWDDARTLTLAEAMREAMLFLDALPSGAPSITANRDGLSPREVEVLRLVAAGKSNREIAAALSISTNTVFHHITSILTKTNTANRTEAAAYAYRHGLAG